MEVSFKGYGTTVENLTVTKVFLLNRGREPIRKSDIVKTETLRIKVRDGYLILAVSSLFDKPANQLSAVRSADRTQVAITFDHLDHWDGAVMQVVHTAKEDQDVTLAGRIIGAGEPRRLQFLPSILEVLLTLGALVVVMVGFFTLGWGWTSKEFDHVAFGLVCVYCVPVMIWRTWKYAQRPPPRPYGKWRPYKAFWA